MSQRPWRPTFRATTLATVLGVSAATVRRWRAQGALADYTPEALAVFLRTYTDWRGRLPR